MTTQTQRLEHELFPDAPPGWYAHIGCGFCDGPDPQTGLWPEPLADDWLQVRSPPPNSRIAWVPPH